MVVDTFASEQDRQRIALTFDFVFSSSWFLWIAMVVYLNVSRIIENNALEEAHTEPVINSCTLSEDNYGQEMITPNIHLSLRCCRDYGPLYSFWCYSLKIQTSPKNPIRKFDGPEGENQDDDQTDASEAKTNTLTSAKISVQTEFRLSELNPNEPFLIKNKFDIL
ncbi:hypothetical protein RhiirC2_713188 [Rhizophagus irregularis]|uniref:Uncharacterized protein n=1 Tax=Rhizophagus irregularis TaxID=588596 RepID=A0A2N1N489_9GLOM|nr:hypothetical protein RhiirC2_713188 [Rhizophagus irregularis]